jgi:prevent-host-death family protein
MDFTLGQEHSCTATQAKNELGRILDQVVRGDTVVITKHDTPRAVLISVERFNALRQAPQLKFDALTAEFDELLAGMQTSTARNAMERAFNASPMQLGKVAVLAARKRG